MEQKIPITIKSLTKRDEKKITIGNKAFIVGKTSVKERKEIICSRYFRKNRVVEGRAIHFEYQNSFLVRGKLLIVSASFITDRNPHGIRVHVKASYDGVLLGDFGFMRATIGAGTHGNWPEIITPQWELLIKLDIYENEQGNLHFSIEDFENIDLSSFTPLSIKNFKYRNDIDSLELPDSFLKNKFKLEEISAFRKAVWEIEVNHTENNTPGKLTCYHYQGYQKYDVTSSHRFFEIADSFYGKSIDDDDLFSLEWKTENEVQQFFTWDAVTIQADLNDGRFEINEK
jgi:hypothetical protein